MTSDSLHDFLKMWRRQRAMQIRQPPSHVVIDLHHSENEAFIQDLIIMLMDSSGVEWSLEGE